MNEDFQELLEALVEHGARFLVCGAHALAVHGVPRATGDLDIWISRESENVERTWAALLEFGAPVESLGEGKEDLGREETVVQIGVPPRRIDLLTSLTGLDFEEAWAGRAIHVVGELSVPFLGRESLVKNKRALGRTKDMADLESLGE